MDAGREAYRSQSFSEAVAHYTRVIDTQGPAGETLSKALSNRALARLQLCRSEHFLHPDAAVAATRKVMLLEVISDCNAVLGLFGAAKPTEKVAVKVRGTRIKAWSDANLAQLARLDLRDAAQDRMLPSITKKTLADIGVREGVIDAAEGAAERTYAALEGEVLPRQHPLPSTERALVVRLDAESSEPKDRAVSSAWVTQWTKAALAETSPPALDNAALAATSPPAPPPGARWLRPDARMEEDYAAITSSAFAALQAWHGGGPEIIIRPLRNGVVGLRNLGNTCFMNSLLQCLNFIRPLVILFTQTLRDGRTLSRRLNRENPLGTKGEVTLQYARLMQECWEQSAENDAVVSPHRFKSTLGAHDPRFAGFGQEDADELFNSIIDKLHEDLNEVPEPKPLTPDVDPVAGDTDASLSAKWWANDALRHRSAIYDMFCGQFRVHTQCGNPACRHTSLKFDHFKALHLAIPEPARRVTVNLVRRAPAVPLWVVHRTAREAHLAGTRTGVARALPPCYVAKRVKCTVTLTNARLSVRELKAHIAQRSGIAATLLIVCRQTKSYAAEPQHLDTLLADDDEVNANACLVAFEIAPAVAPAAEARALRAAALHRWPSCTDAAAADAAAADAAAGAAAGAAAADVAPIRVTVQQRRVRYGRKDHWGYPLVLELAPGSTLGDLHVAIAQQLRPYVVPEAQARVEAAEWARTMRCVAELSSARRLPNRVLPRIYDFLPHGPAAVAREMLRYYQIAVSRRAEFRAATRLRPLAPDSTQRLPRSASLTTRRLSRNVYVVDWNEDGAAAMIEKDTAMIYTSCKELGGAKECDVSISLADCLDKFTRKAKAHWWTCPKCKSDHDALQEFSLWDIPEVLVVQLKRFTFTPIFGGRAARGLKVSTRVSFPLDGFDLAPYVGSHQLAAKEAAAAGGGGAESAEEAGALPPLLYDLVAVSNHSGTLSFGHYTAYARSFVDEEWYSLDDSRAQRVDAKDVAASEGYVHVYQRRKQG